MFNRQASLDSVYVPCQADKKYKKVIEDFANTSIQVELASNQDWIQKIDLQKMINATLDRQVPVIFTFTPGPFAAEVFQEEFTEVNNKKQPLIMPKKPAPEMIGCLAQLNALQKIFAVPSSVMSVNEALVVAVNQQPSIYQLKLLTEKNLSNIYMISDYKNQLQEAFALPTFTFEGKQYLQRFSYVITPNRQGKIFTLPNQVNEITAQEHAMLINHFIKSMKLNVTGNMTLKRRLSVA